MIMIIDICHMSNDKCIASGVLGFKKLGNNQK